MIKVLSWKRIVNPPRKVINKVFTITIFSMVFFIAKVTAAIKILITMAHKVAKKISEYL
jgi:hypothetical protein